MRVALVSGPCPANRCGVGDYTNCLANVFKAMGIETEVITSGNWKMLDGIRAQRQLQNLGFDIVHIQYPTAGFGTHLGPQALAMLRRCVITIHEASQAHILRKSAVLLLTFRAQHIVFTTDHEREFVLSCAPWIARRSSSIPIPSNIDKFTKALPRKLNEIIYFGLIMPGKGLEEVLRLAKLIKSRGSSLEIRVIGNAPEKHVAYFDRLRRLASDLPIIWEHGLTREQISERLASSSIAYLPFPDGASERRASLKAALVSGVVVVTTRGQHTPSGLEGAVRFCNKPDEALGVIQVLLQSPPERAALVAKGYEYMRPCTWEDIAERHLAIYNNVLGSRLTT